MRTEPEPQLVEPIKYDTVKNIYDVLQSYRKVALERVGQKESFLVAINRLKSDIEDIITNWEIANQ